MKKYEKPNTQEQTVNETPCPIDPDGHIEMEEQRPTGDDWVASKSGKWVESPSFAKEKPSAQTQAKHQKST